MQQASNAEDEVGQSPFVVRSTGVGTASERCMLLRRLLHDSLQ
jgi:hypothetical protein